MNTRREWFCEDHIKPYFINLRQALVTKIHSMSARELTPELIPGVIQRFVDNNTYKPLELCSDGKILHEPVEGEVAVAAGNGAFSRAKTLVVELEIPFIGDSKLFDLHPSSYNFLINPAEKRLNEGSIAIRLDAKGKTAEQLRKTFENEIRVLSHNILEQRNDVHEHNQMLRAEIESAVEQRIAQFRATDQMILDIGYPVKRRDEPLNTRILPLTRKPVSLPPAAAPVKVSAAAKAILDNRIYEDILGTLSGMSVAIERSPKAFAGMQEETLRTWFLVALNGVYQGAATAETFNMEGKADITIRHNGDILFIAECKFWSGPKGLGEAIDQLLGYLTHREQRGTILLFNRNRDFSAVLGQIPGVVRGRPDFIRHETAPPLPSAFRFALRSKADPGAEVVITLLAFAVPNMSGESGP